MPKKTIEIVLDDIDGQELTDAKPIQLSWNGVTWDMYVSDKNAKKINDQITEWTKNASTAAAASRSSTARKASGRTDLDDIRKWARENGHEVSDRGRVAKTIIEAYDAR